MKSLSVESSSYSSLLFSVLLQKLPPELRLVMSREIREDNWNLDSLLKQLEEEIKARERAMPPSTQPSTGRKIGQRNDSTGTLLALTNPPSCCFCHQPHPSSGCQTVLDIGERKQILKRSGRCFICLKKYHISKECRSATRCRKCRGRHHVSICTKDSSETTRPAIQSGGASPTRGASSVAPQPSLNPRASTFSPATTNSMYAGTNTQECCFRQQGRRFTTTFSCGG